MSKEWFETWFDTHYYHLLYRNRNEVEARQFIDALLLFLSPKAGAKFIDVACGKGRHSKYLCTRGFEVIGIDLSQNSINEAQEEFKTDPKIEFFQHDIRKPFPVSNCHYAVNLFTSFGYFDNEEEHLQALCNIHDSLMEDGVFVIDYLNTSEVLLNLKKTETKQIEGITFSIKRYLEENSIVKLIEVTDKEKKFQFEERVRAFSKQDLERLLTRAGFEIKTTFGNYQLDPCTSESKRVIIVAIRKA
ncbi:MAG: class I SAM-dependent methyltransferase [Salibacteraceae bacterium]